ncbi:MAG: biotin--[acetyl-CoA-carboxylase] ligase [Treponema sp.]|jgi:BirA family biotin operon repressor/biotin-[acetyl-CoA-carboxylase] ligase|nr:biotin--[acetyl-CoA-carboxylase] ligase [Treponema sp.]
MMEVLSIKNPFNNAPIFHVETVSSTMDAARDLAARGFPHGTVIAADRQSAGRGRTLERAWQSEPGNLYCTLLLRYSGFSDIPKAVTLKTGLAVAYAVEDAAAGLTRGIHCAALVKWPNDIMLRSASGTDSAKKAAGIISESDGKTVFIGIGVNVAQTRFPDHLQKKATSIACVCGASLEHGYKFRVLEYVLFHMDRELRQTDDSWRERLSERLYMKDKRVRFIAGSAGSDETVEGILRGIRGDGSLLIEQDQTGGKPRGVEAFFTGELDVYPRDLHG